MISLVMIYSQQAKNFKVCVKNVVKWQIDLRQCSDANIKHVLVSPLGFI